MTFELTDKQSKQIVTAIDSWQENMPFDLELWRELHILKDIFRNKVEM